MMSTTERSAGIDVASTAHSALTTLDLGGLRALFDAEYLSDFGEWDPELPYGYSPHDMHTIARIGDDIVGHVGWQRRRIVVGTTAMTIAGVGGVLTAPRARGQRLGTALMDQSVRSMKAAGGIEFGYLGCREEVVEFYESCGWVRVSAVERSIDRSGKQVVQAEGAPILVRPLIVGGAEWPTGPIDLRGRAW